MALAKIECMCATCGKKFEYKKTCRNCAEVESFSEWAKEHIDECPECYKERIKEENAAKAAEIINKYGFPEIIGISNKEIAYANNLRNRLLSSDRIDKLIAKHDKIFADLQDPEVVESIQNNPKYAKYGSMDKFIEAVLINNCIAEIHAIRYECRAQDIIDALTYRC